MKFTAICMCLAIIGILSASPVSIKQYLPADARLDGSQDLSEYLQKAVNENKDLLLDGSGDPGKPLIYGIKIGAEKTGLVIPSGHTLRGGKGSEIKRIPSAGKLLVAQKSVRVSGITINGNKAAHWPEFDDLRNTDMGLLFAGNCVIEDCRIYDNPGIAFGTYANNSVVRRCKAQNSGYIDLKFKADFYQGKWDRWSGDSFYIRGNNNVVIDCDSEDAFRWDYTTCHENSGNTVYVNCTGRDLRWRTYGFIDIEGCDGMGSTMINCKSPDGSIAISTANSKLINCEAGYINVHNADNVTLIDNRTLGGGLAVGGWSSAKKTQVRGGAAPMVVGNEVNRSSAGAGVPQTADWSLSVFSTDGVGLVADNVLNEYKAGETTGPGMKTDNVTEYNNTVRHRIFELPDKQLTPRAKKTVNNQLRNRLMSFSQQVPDMLKQLGVKKNIVAVTFPEIENKFILDRNNEGEKLHWEKFESRPEKLRNILIAKHWDAQVGHYAGAAWYFMDIPLDEDLQHNCDTVYLLFGGVEKEARVYVNGKLIGENKVWNKPFLFEVAKKDLKFKNDRELNNISVRAFSGAGMGGMYAPFAVILAK